MPRKKIAPEHLDSIIARVMEFRDEPFPEFLDDDLDVDIDFDFDSLPHAPHAPATSTTKPPTEPTSGSRKISLRVPVSVLTAFRAQALEKGTRYQTLINRSLCATVLGWGSA